MSTKQYTKPQVIQLGDAVQLTLGLRVRRRDYFGINNRRYFF